MSEQPCPFYFRIFLPATRSRIVRVEFKVQRPRDGLSVSNALLLDQSLPAFIGHHLDQIGDGTLLQRCHLFQFVSLLVTHRQVELPFVLVLFRFWHWHFFCSS